MDTLTRRSRSLAALGASPAEVEELLAYTANHFDPDALRGAIACPLEPEPYIEAWKEYAARVAPRRSIEPLRELFPQLRFPIRAGISADETYRDATRHGALAPIAPDAVVMRAPVSLVLHEHPAGPIPAFITADRDDFVALLRAFTARNEPAAVPASQGATVVAGYNNWDRIRRAGGDWQVLEKWQYQDRFIIVSDGPYSGVAAGDLGLTEPAWRAHSVAIRLEHEAAHYFTKRVFNSMKNRLHDELIADWAGIRAAAGRFRADWFLRFMGLEAFPAYRAGGRLENYRIDPVPLTDGAFRVLQTVTHRAAMALERFERDRPVDSRSQRDLAVGLIQLVLLGPDEIAADDGLERLEDARRRAEALVGDASFSRS